MRATPIGARVLVTDIDPEVSVVKRMNAVGLHAVVLDENAPKPTSGLVVAVGSDPLIQELCSVGDVVTFGRNSGTFCQIEGVEYRSLELNELILVIKPAEAPPRSTP